MGAEVGVGNGGVDEGEAEEAEEKKKYVVREEVDGLKLAGA